MAVSLCGCNYPRDSKEIERLNKSCVNNRGIKKVNFYVNGTDVYCHDGANFNWVISDLNDNE